jgi:biotin carboxylase
MREALAHAGVRRPRFAAFDEGDDPAAVWTRLAGDGWRFPVVVKPLLCSASRGVIRADDEAAFATAWRRLHALLQTPALRAVEDPDGHRILVESFVPGVELALEGLLRDGALTTLALFDKPDPLDGPFFEETIYVTPSRHAPAVQRAVADEAAAAARAIGLSHGPIHAELRLAPEGPVAIEVAARSIGGLCARTLRFGLDRISLEELVIRHALGRELGPLDRRGAAGVIMLPIPAAACWRRSTAPTRRAPCRSSRTCRSPRASARCWCRCPRAPPTSASCSPAARRPRRSRRRCGRRTRACASASRRYSPSSSDFTAPNWRVVGSAQQNHDSVSRGTRR